MASSLLFANSYPVNDKIRIHIPTVEEILNDEDNYNGVVSAVAAAPQDFMVELDDIGIAYDDISSFELFTLLFSGLKESDTSLVFKNLDLSKFELMVNPNINDVVLRDNENDITIDKHIHQMIRQTLYRINHIERHDTTPANEQARSYMIERARIKKKRALRRRRNAKESQLEEYIVAMVNSEPYKYNFEETKKLTIYQFYSCLHQVVKKTNFNNLMVGYYTGSIDSKHVNQKELNWLTSK